MDSQWILNKEKWGKSGAYQQNFLWKSNKYPLYIMDNHRAAAWCWGQHVDEKDFFQITHVDYHTDTTYGELKHWMKSLKGLSLKDLSFTEYLSLKYKPRELTPGQNHYTFTWDNYITIFYELFKKQIRYFNCCVVEGEHLPEYIMNEDVFQAFLPHDVIDEIEAPFQREKSILNIDLDFFVYQQNGPRKAEILYTENYIQDIADKVKQKLDEDRFLCVTIALSPETSGGWENAVKLSKMLCKRIDDSFTIDESKIQLSE